MVDAHDRYTREFEFDKNLLNETLGISRNVIATITLMKYPDNKNGIQSAFILTILTNLVGNLVIELSDKNVPNSLENNLEEFISQLRNWADEIKQLKTKSNNLDTRKIQ